MVATITVTTRTGKYVHAAVQGHSTTLCGKPTGRAYRVDSRITCTICYERAAKDARYLASREEWIALDKCPFCAPDEPCALHTPQLRSEYDRDVYDHERMTGQHSD